MIPSTSHNSKEGLRAKRPRGHGASVHQAPSSSRSGGGGGGRGGDWGRGEGGEGGEVPWEEEESCNGSDSRAFSTPLCQGQGRGLWGVAPGTRGGTGGQKQGSGVSWSTHLALGAAYAALRFGSSARVLLVEAATALSGAQGGMLPAMALMQQHTGWGWGADAKVGHYGIYARIWLVCCFSTVHVRCWAAGRSGSVHACHRSYHASIFVNTGKPCTPCWPSQ